MKHLHTVGVAQHTDFSYWIHHGTGGDLFGLVIAVLVLVVLPIGIVIDRHTKASRAEAQAATQATGTERSYAGYETD